MTKQKLDPSALNASFRDYRNQKGIYIIIQVDKQFIISANVINVSYSENDFMYFHHSLHSKYDFMYFHVKSFTTSFESSFQSKNMDSLPPKQGEAIQAYVWHVSKKHLLYSSSGI